MFVSHHTLKWTRTCRSHGRHPHAHTAHFLLNRHTPGYPERQGLCDTPARVSPPACRTRADPRLSDRLMNGEVPCRLTARASPFASHGPRLAGDGAHGTGARAERQTRMIGGGHMDAERDTDGTTDAHEGDHTPADGAGTEGEGGKPDTRPGDRLATIRRTLWWIGLALQLPFALTLIHFDTPYLILERILCAIPPRLASDPSSIVGIPALETEWCREFLALVLGAVCWVTAGVMRLVADSPSNHGKETLPVRIFAGIITIIVLMATGITGLFLGIAAF